MPKYTLYVLNSPDMSDRVEYRPVCNTDTVTGMELLEQLFVKIREGVSVAVHKGIPDDILVEGFTIRNNDDYAAMLRRIIGKEMVMQVVIAVK